jgi:hypothetical protein
MRNILDKSCRKNQDTQCTFKSRHTFYLQQILFQKSCHLSDLENTRNACCVSIATMVMQMHHNVMLYVYCLSSLIVSFVCGQRQLCEYGVGWENIVLFKDAINCKDCIASETDEYGALVE